MCNAEPANITALTYRLEGHATMVMVLIHGEGPRSWFTAVVFSSTAVHTNSVLPHWPAKLAIASEKIDAGVLAR